MDFIPLFWTALLSFGAGFAACWFLKTKVVAKAEAIEAKADAIAKIVKG
jgi:hypothetical protein